MAAPVLQPGNYWAQHKTRKNPKTGEPLWDQFPLKDEAYYTEHNWKRVDAPPTGAAVDAPVVEPPATPVVTPPAPPVEPAAPAPLPVEPELPAVPPAVAEVLTPVESELVAQADAPAKGKGKAKAEPKPEPTKPE